MTEHKFKPGDLVFSIQLGWVTLEESGCEEYPLSARCPDPDTSYVVSFTPEGRFDAVDTTPSLFTVAQAKLLGYEPPKRKVKKTRQIFVNVYKDGSAYADPSEEKAKTIAGCFPGAEAIAIPVTVEYDVEE